MNIRIVCVAVSGAVIVASACAPVQLANVPLRKGTIELWRDAQDKCHSHTTPYVKVKKGREKKVEWKIVDETDCTASQDVEVRFDKGDNDPLPSCSKKNRRKIECTLGNDALTGPRKYSVWLGGEQEDPVLEIEQ